MSLKSRCRYEFGPFTADPEVRVLMREGEIVSLPPKVFDVLLALLRSAGAPMSRDDLIKAVWGDAFVEEGNLTNAISVLRKALGSDVGESQYIVTIPRRGYRFAAPIRASYLPPSGTQIEIEERSTDRLVIEETEEQTGIAWRSLLRLRRSARLSLAVIGGLAVLGAVIVVVRPNRPVSRELAMSQLTYFTDSVVSPALSPDGRMLAFIRSDNWFQTPDQIYVKLLPNGDPVQITHDPRQKYGLSFSPDGSRIAYTVSGLGMGWNTFTISPLGGEPSPLLTNAAGLTWLDERRLLFSEIRTGSHMGVVTATENRSEYRRIYFPQDERGMVHLSYASPDRNWVLVVEMDPVWQPCRVVPMDGTSNGRQVGPRGKCTAAAWSPDGKWMYFGVDVEGERHLWRQRFPRGEPEQITFGLTEEEGVAVAPDGRSLITSIGMRQSAVWIHDSRGERAISSEGFVTSWQSGLFGSFPRFSRDGRSLFYQLGGALVPGAA